MQTFLSETTLYGSVAVLDNVRLNKQLVEGNQILNAILITPEGGGQRVNGKVPFASNHPATNMWRGSEGALIGYLWLCKYELDGRGTETGKSTATLTALEKHFDTQPGCGFPSWYNDPIQRDKVLYTHRASLYKKDPVHYHEYKVDALALDRYSNYFVCCPGKHAPYYYPTHVKEQR